MAQPIWITPAGSLGTIPEGIFYQVPLQAYEPDIDETVYYEIIAGQLPPGIQCEATGLIVGIPHAMVSVQGVPAEVSRDVTSKFAVRAYTKQTIGPITVINRLADRTFTLTVTGQDAPEFITPPGLIAQYFDGTEIDNLQIEYTDTDPADIVIVKLVAGSLPPGLTISPSGLISGFIAPNVDVDAIGGFSRDAQGYDEFPFDFATNSNSLTFEFVLEITDGYASDLRTFSIFVISRSSLSADTDEFTADNTFITADATPDRTPILLTPEGSIGIVRSDNFYAFKFDGYDADGEIIEYEITLGLGIGFDSGNINFDPGSYDHDAFDQGEYELPPGLTLDPLTGWLYGYIPDQGPTETTYEFSIRVRQLLNPLVISDYYLFNITIVGPVATDVTWLVDSHLGTIINGSTSTFYVAADNIAGLDLQYKLKSGSASSLPQGLELLPSGHIAGRVSFNTFAIDGGATTLDADNPTLVINIIKETTFDMLFSFVVNAYSETGYISVFRTFTILLVREYNEPYENLYIQAMPPKNDRGLVASLLDDTEIFAPNLIYRSDDPNFGVAKKVIYNHAFGLTSATVEDYIASLDLNHYWKNLILGSIETAQALDDEGNIIYELVYSRIIGGLANNEGVSVSKQVILPYPINPNDSSEIDSVYPNSLQNMRDQVIDVIGQISNVLPRWMLSKQTNGRVLGFTPAWIIAYTNPGKSGQLAYNIKTQFGTQLNLVDFEIDRYELDALLSKNWDPVEGQWFPEPAETTFDRFGRQSGLNFLGSVDFATDQAFIDINNRTVSYINSIGGIDGPIQSNINGKKLIFVRQEDYVEPPGAYWSGDITPDQAWTKYVVPYDESGYDPSDETFDEAIVIPGQLAHENDSAIPNERLAIWLMHVDENQIVTLELLENTVTNDYVTVRNGVFYKTAPLYIPSTAAAGLTFINWQPIPSNEDTDQTIFDGNAMKFIAPVDMYTNTTDFNKFLVFPKRNILD